jgi:hypothetical protein
MRVITLPEAGFSKEVVVAALDHPAARLQVALKHENSPSAECYMCCYMSVICML